MKWNTPEMADNPNPEFDTENLRSGPLTESAETTKGSNWIKIAIMFSIPFALIAAGAYFWMTSGQYVSTDNAYVKQDIVSISPEVSGKVIEAAVSENDLVKAGDLLFRIDAAPYELAVQQANAQIAAAQVNVQNLETSYAVSGVDIAAAKSDIAFSEAAFQRQAALMKRGFTTKADYEAALHSVELARAKLSSAQASVTTAKARLSNGSAVPGENPAIATAKVSRSQAELNLSRSIIRAPISGRISQSNRLQIGQTMMSGLPVLSIVSEDKSWIEANFKETDLAHMKVGQVAEIKFDAYPDMKLKGHVESIGAGTGSEFSVLPAQNANGNWVKVTQRVPVRIAIDSKPTRPLIAGLSADVSVAVNVKGK